MPRGLLPVPGLVCAAVYLAVPTSVTGQANDVPFEMNSLRATYPLVAALTGSYRIDGDSMVVVIESGVVGSNIPKSLGASGVLRALSLRVGIGELTETGWTVDTTGTEHVVADSLLTESAVELGDLRFVVPLEPTEDLGERWLFFGLRGTHQGLFDSPPGPFSSYICDELNLLGANAASEDRAARMRARYAEAC